MRKPSERFWAKVSKGDDCWLWTAALDEHGYGKFRWTNPPEGRLIQAHRASWILTFGPVPDGLFVLHHCDNPPCVRPSHLFLGTIKDNYDDMVRKGRRRLADPRLITGRPRKLSEEQATELQRRLAAGEQLRALARELGVGENTVRRYVGRLAR